jgi:CubicO group peptidase (beta-lactamase class C family)
MLEIPMLNLSRSCGTALLGTLLLLVASASIARDLPTSSPKREGVSPQRLERITEHMNQAVKDGTMVGGLGMITRNGKVIYNEVYGLSDREANKKMEEDAIFRIYSMSKPITAVALMILYEEGRFFLNDPVAKYLPELADLELAISTADGETGMVSDGTTSRGVGAGDESKLGQTRKPMRQPTIRDLLRHTAGFTYGIFGDTEVDKMYREAGIFDQATIEEFVAKLGTVPLQYEPGSKWHYSVSVDVQGRLVEVLSGMRFGEFLEQRIFEPLGMTDTSFVIPAEKLDRLARLYSPEGTSFGTDGMWKRSYSKVLVPTDGKADENYMEGATLESGGGGLLSTASDYMRFSLMMLNGGELNGERILSPKTVELMTTDHLGGLAMGFGRAGVGFGLGFAVALNTGDIGEIGSNGEYNWGGAAGTRFWIDPEEQLIGLFMVQSIPHQTRLASEFKILTYQAVVE